MAHQVILQLVTSSPDSHDAVQRLPTIPTKDGRIDPTFLSFCHGGVYKIGSSPECNIVVDDNNGDIAEAHIQLSLQLQTGILLLREQSTEGSFVSPLGSEDRGEEKLKFRHAYLPILQPMTVSFGKAERLKFHLLPTSIHSGKPEYDTQARRVYLPFLDLDPAVVYYYGYSCRLDVPIRNVYYQFVILQRIGKGSTGDVRACLRVSDGKMFAIKARYDDHEADIHRSLSHPHIVELVHEVKFGPRTFSILEYAPGLSLAHYMKFNGSPRFSPEQIFPIVTQILSAVIYLHGMDYIYHDVVPYNILIFGMSPPLVKLCDFNLTQHAPLGVMDGGGGGTKRNHSGKVDVYSLGITILTMLGHWPWMTADAAEEVQAGQDPNDINLPALDAEELNDYGNEAFVRLIETMIEHNPNKRPDSSQCLAAFEEIQRSLGKQRRNNSWIMPLGSRISTIIAPKLAPRIVTARIAELRQARQATNSNA
ncbi:Protein kinase domain-containing protein 31 [Elsinoe fawcettii]|nr:Protein kinase domain-containing protein 31 [Elsinoe fawcettii]